MQVRELLGIVPQYDEVGLVVTVAKMEKRSERIDFLGRLLREAYAISEAANDLGLVAEAVDLAGVGDDLAAELRVKNDFWYRTGECQRTVLYAMDYPMNAGSFAKIVKAFNGLREFLEELLETQPE